MRTQLLTGLQALSLGTFSVSTELPWDNSGQPLYLKNLKTIYVDESDSEESTVFQTLNGSTIENRTTTVEVWTACDAKQKPTNYDTLMESIRALKDLSTIEGPLTRECDVTRTFDEAILITQFVFRFTELKTS